MNDSRRKPESPAGETQDPLHPERTLITRRDFLSSGLMTFAGTMLLPGVIQTLMISEAKAALGCASSGAPAGLLPFILFDCAGGAAIHGNWIGVDKSGRQLVDYSKVGLEDLRATEVDEILGERISLGAPMAGPKWTETSEIDPLTGLETIRKTLDADSLYSQIFVVLASRDPVTGEKLLGPDGRPLVDYPNLRMGTIATSSIADSQSNHYSPLSLLQLAGLRGSQIPNALGTRAGDSGGNSMLSDFKPELRTLQVSTVDSLTTALSFGRALEGQQRSGLRDKLSRALSRLSSTQIGGLSKLHLFEQVSQLLQCSYQEVVNRFDLSASSQSSSIDPRSNADVQGIYGLAAAGMSSNAALESALVWNVLQGNSGPIVITIGGCDYHTGNRTDGDNKDLGIGTSIARAIRMAKLLNKAFAFAVITDGGIYSSQGRIWQGDSAENLAVFGVYDPNGPREMRRTQIGAITAGQGVDRTHFLGSDPSLVAHALFANYLAASGKPDLYAQAATGSVKLQRSQFDDSLLFPIYA